MKIRKTENGTWTTQVAMIGNDGKRHWKRFTGKTKQQVRNDATEYMNRHAVYMESLALEDCMKRFLDRREEILSPNTIRGYKGCERTLKKDYAQLCMKSIDRITQADLQNMVDDMRNRGKKPKTIRNKIGFLSAIYAAESIRMPSVSLPEPREAVLNVPNGEIMQKVAKAAKGTRMEAPLGLAVFGLRCGEICAVTSGDIDDRNMLHVSKAIATDDDGFLHEKAPKTFAGDRYILIPSGLADLIRTQKRAWPASPKALSDAFPHLLNRAKIPADQRFRLHDCRHFFVSYCHELGLTDAQIIELSGHRTDYIMKRFYRHALTDRRETVSESLGNLLAGSL